MEELFQILVMLSNNLALILHAGVSVEPPVLPPAAPGSALSGMPPEQEQNNSATQTNTSGT